MSLLAEFEQELGTTRKFLERVPEGRLTWRPHDKSMTVGQLALHIAQVPEGVLRKSEPDEAAPPNFGAGRLQPASIREVLEALDHSADYVRQSLPAIDDSRMRKTFRVVQEGARAHGHAARRVFEEHYAQPLVSPSRAARRLSSPSGDGRSSELRPQRR